MSSEKTVEEGAERLSPDRKVWQRLAGYAFALGCLAWVFHDVSFAEFGAPLRTIKWGWVILAIGADILSYMCQGWRWQLLVRPRGSLSVLRATQAVYAGLFVNEILPLRAGELVRTYLASRWTAVPILSIVPSIAVERLFDGIWMAMCIGLTAAFVPLPRDLLQAGEVLGGVMLVVTGVFGLLVIRERMRLGAEPAAGAPNAPSSKGLRGMLLHLSRGVAQIGVSPSFFASFGLSLGVLLLQGLAFWLTILSCGLRLSFWEGFAVFLIVHLGTAIPNAPANVGSYQFFTVAGLLLFGVDKTQAASFSVVVFVILTVPLWLLGWLAIARSGWTLAELRGKAQSLKSVPRD